MELKPKHVEEFKRIWKEAYKQDLDDSTAQKYAQEILNYVELVMPIAQRMYRWDQKLKDCPQGYSLPDDGVYSCVICYNSVSGQTGWYDQYGIKCMPCQKAVEENIVPGGICKEHDSWHSMSGLKSEFKLHPATVKKMIRGGKLKARVIKADGRDHYYVFLKSENDFKTLQQQSASQVPA